MRLPDRPTCIKMMWVGLNVGRWVGAVPAAYALHLWVTGVPLSVMSVADFATRFRMEWLLA